MVTFCLSKALSCPLGSVVAGSRELSDRAARALKRPGGGMRQAGIIAAAGIVALEKMVDRLEEDHHKRAQILAQGLNEIPGLRVDLKTVETNMVYVDHTLSGLSSDEVLSRFKAVGVLASARQPDHVRFVPTRHHSRQTIYEVHRRIRIALEGAA